MPLYWSPILALGQKYFVLRQNNSSNVLFAFHIKINAEALGFWVFCENCFENHWIPSDISHSHSWIKYYMSTLQWSMQWIHCLVRRSTWEMHVMAGLSNLWELMPDDLKWSWCKNNRNKVYNKYNAVKLSWNHPSHWTMETFSSMKSALAPERLGTTVYGINTIFFSISQES